jgi:hypothetical protein
MFHVALVNKHTGEKTYLETFKGVKSTWLTESDAQSQINGLKSTCGYGSREPVNFDYVIEPTPDTTESLVK